MVQYSVEGGPALREEMVSAAGRGGGKGITRRTHSVRGVPRG